MFIFKCCVISQRYSKMKAIHNLAYSSIIVKSSCVISQRYSKMKAIHNVKKVFHYNLNVVLYLKDTQKWKQFTTACVVSINELRLCYISKILKNESNSQPIRLLEFSPFCCVISQRYSKMKAIHNTPFIAFKFLSVVLYLKDTQKWKQFTTYVQRQFINSLLCYISKILKNESNSQRHNYPSFTLTCCVISQRYSKMKAIHNSNIILVLKLAVVLYLKDTQKWKQFTTVTFLFVTSTSLCYISKILKNESNSQH